MGNVSIERCRSSDVPEAEERLRVVLTRRKCICGKESIQAGPEDGRWTGGRGRVETMND
jgi:hypothetical protein